VAAPAEALRRREALPLAVARRWASPVEEELVEEPAEAAAEPAVEPEEQPVSVEEEEAAAVV